jgi:hypothetical protein
VKKFVYFNRFIIISLFCLLDFKANLIIKYLLMSDKAVWPELVGHDGQEAVNQIKGERPDLNVIIV